MDDRWKNEAEARIDWLATLVRSGIEDHYQRAYALESVIAAMIVLGIGELDMDRIVETVKEIKKCAGVGL